MTIWRIVCLDRLQINCGYNKTFNPHRYFGWLILLWPTLYFATFTFYSGHGSFMSWILLAISSPTQPPKLRIATGHRWDLSLLVTLVANTCRVLEVSSRNVIPWVISSYFGRISALSTNKNKRGSPPKMGSRENRLRLRNPEKSHTQKQDINQ